MQSCPTNCRSSRNSSSSISSGSISSSSWRLQEEQTIEDFVRDNTLVSDLVKKCGGRCHVIDNKYWKNNQQDEYRSNQQKQTHSIIDEHYSLSVSNRRIVILGRTGTGKSSVANTIVGEELFKIGDTANSETSECRAETKPVNGRNITLIDTPGFFDTDRPEEELKSEIVKCITEFSPGPHAFLIVFKVERFTKQEQAVITKINQYFSEDVFKYVTVLFTHGDQLKDGQTIEDFVHNNKLVSDLVKKCGGRCHVIDNKYWKNNQQDEYRSNQFQVKELLNTIEKMIEANKGSCYTNEMLQAVEEMIKQEEERIRESSGDMSEKEIREKAKDKVSTRFLTNLAGITTGALLGALFGGVVMVRLVIYAFKEARLALATAAVGTAAVGVGVAAAGTAAAAGTSVIALTVTCVVVGAVGGGVAGYNAAEGAETVLEAIKRAAEVVKNGSQSITDCTTSKIKSE
ncbi:GTPase IMAP family member 7-like [Anarhichas minor]|uniref:GTPase IMAP family member 7-like n=1 Tax=Anarhichas minor TaxID=65739 RepID=UPI003F7343A9